MNFGLSSLTTLGCILALTACSSSSSSPDITSPAISSATQNRTVDTLGFTVDILMNEPVAAATANMIGSWTSSAGNVTNAVLQADQRTVRLTMDIVSVPGDITFGTIGGVASTGNIDLTAQATDGDTVTVSDGTTAIVFEFTSGGGAAGTNVEVDKGASATTAIAAFIVAFNAQSFNITAAAGAGDSADLTNDNFGTVGDVAITEFDQGTVITLTGMIGGMGVQDLSGNVIAAAINTVALVSSDTTRPAASTIDGVTIAGFDNDRIDVLFNDDMIEAEAENLASWTVEAPIGTAFDLTGATIDYTPATRTASITLANGIPGAAGGNSNNLQTFGDIAASFTTMRDVSGNIATATAIGVDSVTGLSMGDDEGPTFVANSADGVANTVDVHFSEPVQTVLFADLYSGGIDSGARFLLTDANGVPAVAATGTITITGDPVDTETFTIDDGAGNTDTFEWDDNATITGGNISVAIATGDNNQMATNVNAAIGGSTLAITPAPAANVVNLTNNATGTAGNVAITGTPTNVTIAGMTGGAAAVAGNAPAVGLVFNADGLKTTVDYSPTVPAVGADLLEVYGVRDLAGNQAFALPSEAILAMNAAEPAIDAGNTSVDSVANKNNDLIGIRFDRNMHPFFLTDVTNYSIPGVDLSNALITQTASNEVLITLNGGDDENLTFGQAYNVTIVNNAGTELRSEVGTLLTGNDNQMIVAGGDNTPPTAAGSLAFVGATANTCIIEFTEAVDETAAMAAANYAIAAANPTLVEMLNARSYQLTFAIQPAAAQTLDVQIAAATDLAGNPAIGVMNLAITAADVAAPTATVSATALENEGGDTVSITFSEAVDQTTALNPANYTLTQNGNPVSLTGAIFGYNAGNFRVRIRLASTIDLTTGAPFAVAVSNVTDLSANVIAVQPGAVTVTGDAVDPTIVSSFVNYIDDAAGTTFDVRFSEDIDATFAGTPANWSTDGAAVILTSARTAPNIVRFTLNQPLAGVEQLQVNGLTDVAGNNGGGLISTNPIE